MVLCLYGSKRRELTAILAECRRLEVIHGDHIVDTRSTRRNLGNLDLEGDNVEGILRSLLALVNVAVRVPARLHPLLPCPNVPCLA